MTVAPCAPSVPIQDHNSWIGFATDLGPGELAEFTDHHIDRRPEQETGDDRPGEELGDPPHLEDRENQEKPAGGHR